MFLDSSSGGQRVRDLGRFMGEGTGLGVEWGMVEDQALMEVCEHVI